MLYLEKMSDRNMLRDYFMHMAFEKVDKSSYYYIQCLVINFGSFLPNNL